MGRKHLGAIAALVQVVSLAPPLHAEATTVTVAAPCAIEGTRIDQVVAILRAQLAPVPVEPSTGPESVSTVTVTVDGCRTLDADLQVIVQYQGERKLLRVNLVDVAPIARDRTLALALAESIHSLFTPPQEEENGGAGSAVPTPQGESAPSASPLAAASDTQLQSPRPASEHQGAAAAPTSKRAPEVPGHDANSVLQKPATFTLLSQPLARYVAKTGTPYAGLDVGVGNAHFDFRLRALMGHQNVEDGAIWQGALLGVLSAEWLKLAAHVGVRSELEVGAALASPRAAQPAVSRSASSPHWGVATYLRLSSPLSRHWALASELGVGVASSLTSQTHHVDSMSLSGLFLQASFGVAWGERAP